jgi:hypothetical protein
MTDLFALGDYDGDDKADYAIWRPSSGEWLILYSSDGSQHTQMLGLAGDIPVPQPVSLPTFVLEFGLVSDQELQDADVLVFVPTDLTGDLIDLATGLYGYSHCGIVSGTQMFDVDNTNQPTVPQVEAVDLQTALARQHVGCRFGIEADQAKALCACVMAQVGEGMDWLELVTFGALNIPGTELCTMLIMHCLDNIGFNRAAIGLGGFVSPNQIARVFNAPKGKSAF